MNGNNIGLYNCEYNERAEIGFKIKKENGKFKLDWESKGNAPNLRLQINGASKMSDSYSKFNNKPINLTCLSDKGIL